MKQSRREIEKDLFGGRLRGVAATNALELGVDIGSLDATIHLGFPGSVARYSFIQSTTHILKANLLSELIYVDALL